MAKSACVKCFVLNVGAGPLIRPLSKFFIARALFAADYVSFRDERSQALARGTGFRGRSHVFPDNAYSLKEFQSNDRPRGEQPIVGIAPMPYPVDPPFEAGENRRIYQSVIFRLAKFVSLLVQHCYPITFFGTDIGVDPEAIEDLRSSLRKDHNIVTPPCQPVQSVSEILAQLSGMDYIVTCRFHGVVFAHLLNKPVLAISHHPKVTELMRSLGLSQFCVDIRTFNPIRLAELFGSLVRSQEEVRNRMNTALKTYRSLADAQFDQLFPSRGSSRVDAPARTSAAAHS